MSRKPPHLCTAMAELRPEIDQIDAVLIDLLTERAGYIDRAIELKRIEDLPARIPDRVEEVVTNVKTHAAGKGLDPALAEQIWRGLIEWSIEREEKQLNAVEPSSTHS